MSFRAHVCHSDCVSVSGCLVASVPAALTCGTQTADIKVTVVRSCHIRSGTGSTESSWIKGH